MWPMIAAGALLSGLSQQKNQENQKRQNRGIAESNRYAPLTGNWQQAKVVNDLALQSALKGALGGAMLSTALGASSGAAGSEAGAAGAGSNLVGGEAAVAQQGGGAWQPLAQQNPLGNRIGSFGGNPYITKY